MAAKKTNYLQNFANEINDAYQSYRDQIQVSNTPGPGTDAKANALAAKTRKEVGQVLGAALQGRRYDTKGKQIKK